MARGETENIFYSNYSIYQKMTCIFFFKDTNSGMEIRNHSPDGSSVLVDGVVGGVTGISGTKANTTWKQKDQWVSRKTQWMYSAIMVCVKCDSGSVWVWVFRRAASFKEKLSYLYETCCCANHFLKMDKIQQSYRFLKFEINLLTGRSLATSALCKCSRQSQTPPPLKSSILWDSRCQTQQGRTPCCV